MTSTRGSIAARSVAAAPRRGSLADRLAPRPVVLVVEDEADIAAFVGAFFRASGLEVVHVNPLSEEDATAAVLTHRPHCVMLDLGLVGMTGLDVLRALRAGGPTSAVPVVVVTADARESTERAVWEAGARSFITKPFNVRDLFAHIDDVVRGHVAGRA